jgi:hypothetical protein
MKKNDKSIDRLTSKQIKNLGLDEPSPDFTFKVMQSIALEPQPEIGIKPRKYWWLLVFVPVITAIAWYCMVTFKLIGYGLLVLTSAENNIKPYIASFIDLFAKLKSLTISPFLIVSFIAIISLLIIEDFTARMKHSS